MWAIASLNVDARCGLTLTSSKDQNTRMHSSRMRTARSLPYGGVCVQRGSVSREGLCPERVCVQGGPDQGAVCERGALYLGDPPPPVDRQTPLKLLPCPKLRLQAVIILWRSYCLFSEIRISIAIVDNILTKNSLSAKKKKEFFFLYSYREKTRTGFFSIQTQLR